MELKTVNNVVSIQLVEAVVRARLVPTAEILAWKDAKESMILHACTHR